MGSHTDGTDTKSDLSVRFFLSFSLTSTSFPLIIVMDQFSRSSSREFLEMREIQLSLPTANQMQEPSNDRLPLSQFLRNVPIELLPLLPDRDQSVPAPAAPPAMSSSTMPSSISRSAPIIQPEIPKPPPAPSYHPPYLSHLPNSNPSPRRSRPSFNFLPLLETPSSTPSPSLQEPTNVNVDDSDIDEDETGDPPSPPPLIRPPTNNPISSLSASTPPAPTRTQLPPPSKPLSNSYFPSFPSAPTSPRSHGDKTGLNHNNPRIRASLPSQGLLPPSPISLYTTTPTMPSEKLTTCI